MTLETWVLYLVAVTGLAFAPGPNGLLALSHGALYGRKKTLPTILGGVTGFMGVIAISMFGIGSLMMASAHVLSLLKWIGGAYLVYLGIQLWRSPTITLETTSANDLGNTARFRQGLLAAIANPKVILFFGAFLPQFMTPETSLLAQFIILAATFAVVEFSVEFFVACIAHQLRPWLQKSGQRFNRGCGSVFALLGASLPLSQ
ncbi:LysE family translocator [Photobacterium lutimaris]|uniref:Lysine transporter LysE n=1 Tax=Photobacterium lutimaris TaxID=388278 RepID=A0A2T3IZ08_9GAMM|nr:LysE family translocator [Photobacterium lutimaris]PSU33892.1 lysine transporter LysE [Photobacterium lutimaris]TDR76217.1 threonine/homoserine/homoserine lactone efflux protein [Photobacterium lutimaris]